MKKHIRLILILMSVCVTGIVGLQLFWNYQNYQNTVKAFDHDVNEVLNKAVDREAEQRRDLIVQRFKHWLADTSMVIITADHKNRDSSTVFHTQDRHPRFKEDIHRQFTFGLSNFKQKLDHITPGSKAFLIDHFANTLVKHDIEQGTIYNYTEMLGDSLRRLFNRSKVSLHRLNPLFKQELLAHHINAPFVLNPAKKEGFFVTQAVNTDFRKPYYITNVYAGFESPGIYFLRVMKWVVISSFLLILVTIGCFYYTVRTLLSQAQLMVLKDDFINNITHELNTPLASIKITAESLKNFNHSAETQREYLDIITYQADKLTGMAARILDIRKPITPFAEVNLKQVVIQAVNELQPKIEQAGAIIDQQLDEVFVNGDKTGLLSAFINIIDNALKYNDGKTYLTITLNNNGKLATISFADNGPGISEVYRDQVFDQFFRVPNGDLHDVKGYGLGLSLVSHVIKQHHGTVEVIPNSPAGSIFLIRLPL